MRKKLRRYLIIKTEYEEKFWLLEYIEDKIKYNII